MSFVHCPSCQRAFDLRRHGSCPGCVAARPPAADKPEAKLASATRDVASEDVLEAMSEAAPSDDSWHVAARPAPQPAPQDDRLEQRIVAMVAELAALVERASTTELVAAQRLLAARGLPALASAERRVAQLTAGVAERVAERVTQVMATPRRKVARLAQGLRAAWSGLGAPRA